MKEARSIQMLHEPTRARLIYKVHCLLVIGGLLRYNPKSIDKEQVIICKPIRVLEEIFRKTFVHTFSTPSPWAKISLDTIS